MVPSGQTIVFNGFLSLVVKRLAPHYAEENPAPQPPDLDSHSKRRLFTILRSHIDSD